MNQQLQQQQQQQQTARKLLQLLGLILLLATAQHQQQVSCQARDDVMAPFFSYALTPFNRLVPNTVSGIGSDVSAAQEKLVANLSPSLGSMNEMLKNMQDATSSRYQAMDKMFIRFLAEIAQPENLCRQLLAESRNALKLADAGASSLLGQATSGVGQVSQGASNFMNKFSGLG